MTKHLYYQDSYLTEFTANVLEQSLSGGKPAVVLDQTAFYPDSGGQPCDTGFLNGARVVAVEEDAAGNILHILESAPASGEVRGRIDWARRFDHMQQHTGQHILSQAFLQVAGGTPSPFTSASSPRPSISTFRSRIRQSCRTRKNSHQGSFSRTGR